MGYPQTAIDGFINHSTYEGVLPKDIEDSIFKLVFSKDHYEEEFGVVRKWNEALTTYAPDLSKT